MWLRKVKTRALIASTPESRDAWSIGQGAMHDPASDFRERGFHDVRWIRCVNPLYPAKMLRPM
jgi:hypothetical protein